VDVSTLERYVDALGGHLEIHAVLEDADTKLTALIAAADRKKEMARWPKSHESLAARDARIRVGGSAGPAGPLSASARGERNRRVASGPPPPFEGTPG
jgi:hypothetical protein